MTMSASCGCRRAGCTAGAGRAAGGGGGHSRRGAQPGRRGQWRPLRCRRRGHRRRRRRAAGRLLRALRRPPVAGCALRCRLPHALLARRRIWRCCSMWGLYMAQTVLFYSSACLLCCLISKTEYAGSVANVSARPGGSRSQQRPAGAAGEGAVGGVAQAILGACRHSYRWRRSWQRSCSPPRRPSRTRRQRWLKAQRCR